MTTVKKDRTAKKKMTDVPADELKQIKEQYRILLKNGNDSITIHTIKKNGKPGFFTEVNETACKLFGYSREELLRMTPLDLEEPEFKKKSKEIIRILENDSNCMFERTLIAKSGKKIHAEINSHFFEMNGTKFVMSISRDISKRKITEKALKDSEEHFRKIFEESSLGMVMVNKDFTFRHVNTSFCIMLGYTKQDLLKLTVKDITHPEHIAQDVKNLKMIFGKKLDVYRTEKRYLRKDGGIVWGAASVNAIYDANGKFSYFLSIVKDISEQKLTEKALKDSEARFRKLFEEGRHGIVIVNERFKFVRVNPAFCKMLGYSENEMLTLTFKDITHPDYITGDIENVTRVMQGKIPFYKTDKQYICKNGNFLWSAVTVSAVRNDDGNFMYFLAIIEDITDRKLAEQALQNSETRFRELFDNIGSCVAIYEAVDNGNDFIFKDFNKASEKLYNISRESLKGKSVQKIFPGVREFGLFDVFQHVWKTGEPKLHPVSLYKDDNVTGWFENYVYKLPTGEIVAAFENLTEQKQAEESLRKSETIFRSVIENIQEGIFFMDQDSVIQYRSPSAAMISGFSNDERIGAFGIDLVHPDDIDTLQKAWERLLNHPEKSEEIIFRIKHKDSSWRWIETTVQNLLRNPDIGKILMTMRDITERKKTEEKLRSSEERFRHLIESVTDYIYTVHVDGGIAVRTAHSPGCISITGFTCQELDADPSLWFNMIYGEDKQYVNSKIDKVFKGISISPFEHRIYRKDGTIRWIRNTLVLKKDEHGRLISYDGLISDITELKSAEEAREAMQTQLRQAQKMESLGTFVGGIAHDFNNILSVLQGYSNLMRLEVEEGNPLVEYIDQILSSCEKAVNLTRSLLAFSREQPIAHKPININSLIRNTEKILKRLITEDISLEIDCHNSDIIITGDHSQVDQVLFNLATNARDAMPQGGKITITTSIAETDENTFKTTGYIKPGKYALITFTDTGTGMDKKTIEHIFDPFFTTKEIGKGTGLGMATVYGIVKQHGGYIRILSEIGIGTTFHIYFPASQKMVTETKLDASAIKEGNETILIAEDYDSIRHIMKIVLSKYGYTIIEAVDGEDAVIKFQNFRDIKLAIIDSVMPKKNGLEVYKEIKKINPQIKVIFCSGYTRDVVLSKGIEEKEYNYISKPIQMNELLIKIREILDRDDKS